MTSIRTKIIVFSLFLFSINLSFLTYFHTYEKVISGGDSWGYYTHLVSTFIYHDLGDYHQTTEGTRQEFANFADPFIDKYGIRQSPTGKYVVKYTNGVALVLSPFFGVAHAYCAITKHYPANGFSAPYAILLGIGVLFWTCLAYYFLTKVLLRYFTQGITGITIIAIVLGTNLFYNTAYSYMMSHALLFSFYSFLIYHCDNYYRNNTLRSLILLALSAAIIILIRPNEIYCLLIPACYNISSFNAIKERIILFKKKRVHLLIASACAFIIFIPQLIYWKTFTGSFIYNGYVGESFDFRHPHLYEGFFSYANGWLVWSPIMILALIGILFLYTYARHIMLPLILIFIIHVYIIYSWWCYTYINGFGSRPMEHLYPILSFAMASCITYFFKKWYTKGVLIVCILGAVALNLFQTWQQKKGLLYTQACNKGYYWGVFGKSEFCKKALVGYASEEIQHDNLKQIKVLYDNHFNDTSIHGNCILPTYNRTMRYLSNRIDTLAIFSLEKKLQANYLNISFKNLFPSSNNYLYQWDCPLLIFRHLDKDSNTLYDSSIRPHIITGNASNTIWTNGTPDTCDNINYNLKIAKPNKTTHIIVCTWNPTEQPFYIDDLEIVASK